MNDHSLTFNYHLFSFDVKILHDSIMNILSDTVNENSSVQMEKINTRVLNKLTLCVYPMATIVPFVSSMTGLDNYNLTGQSRFDENIGNLLNIFPLQFV